MGASSSAVKFCLMISSVFCFFCNSCFSRIVAACSDSRFSICFWILLELGISNCTYRQFTTGFFYGKPDENTQIYDNNTYVNEYIYLGIVEAVKDSLCRIEQRNKFCVGDSIEIMKPDGTNVPVTVEAMYTEEGESVDSAPHPKQVLWIKLSMPPQEFDLLRQKNAD